MRFVPKVEIPDYPEWLKTIDAALVKAKCTDKEIHLVLFTDGGCRPTPNGFGGWGVHGYIYHKSPQNVGYGTNGFVPTATGYLNTGKDSESDEQEDDQDDGPALQEFLAAKAEEDKLALRSIKILGYFDGIGNIVPNSTNNEAEIIAAIKGVQMVIALKPKTALFKLDSEYTLKGVNNWLAEWSRSGWRRRDGAPIQNEKAWRELHKLLGEAAEYTELRWTWTKGHSDDVGNNKADYNASAGINAAFNGFELDTITLAPGTKYWNPSNNYNRMLSGPYWYFNAGEPPGQHDGRFIYHQGNHGKKVELLGCVGAESMYSVIAIKEPDPVLEEMRVFHANNLKAGYTTVVVGALQAVFRPSVYNAIQAHGTAHLYKAADKPLTITPNKLMLTTEMDPPLKAFDAIDALNRLEGYLTDYMDKTLGMNLRLTDITDLIYESVTGAKETTYKCRLANSDDNTVVNAVAQYSGPGGETCEASVTLSVGIDLPRRNLFSAVAGASTKVFVLSWPVVGSINAFHYATIVDTGEECGIWAGYHSNLRIVS